MAAMTHDDVLFGSGFLGFPRRSHHVLLPAKPAAAARAGLALYDATLRHQRVAAATGDLLLRARLGGLLRLGSLPPAVDTGWWQRWVRTVADEAVGPVARLAFRLWEDRVAALLIDAHGTPLGFVKAWPDPPGPWQPLPYLQPAALAALTAIPPATFRAPRLLAEASTDGVAYQLFEPLPTGRHVPWRPSPPQLAGMVDEIRQRLAALPRPAHVPAHHAVAHNDLTPRNVRLAGDGRVWVVDWEYACWAPPLVDELRYWTTAGALGPRRNPERAGQRVTALLRGRGSDTDIAEALGWETGLLPRQEAIREVVAREVGA